MADTQGRAALSAWPWSTSCKTWKKQKNASGGALYRLHRNSHRL